MGTGTRVLAMKIHNQGNIITTDILDLAIDGDGFFQIAQQDGTIAYSRDGGFKLSNLGQLVTANGDLLQPVTITTQYIKRNYWPRWNCFC